MIPHWNYYSLLIKGSLVRDFQILVFFTNQHGPEYRICRSHFESSLKGTVRPDWICMKVVPLESPLKGHQPLYVFDFLISVLNI
jgi:hypothetical protein